MPPKDTKRPMLENEECSSDSDMSTYKRVRASSVRDFPQDSGSNAPKADDRGKGTYNDNIKNTDQHPANEVENKRTPSLPEVHTSVDSEFELMKDELRGSDEKDSTEDDEQQKHLSLVYQSDTSVDSDQFELMKDELRGSEDEKDSTEDDEQQKHLSLVSQSGSNDGGERNKVREMLRSFQAVTRKLSKVEETDPKKRQGGGRIDRQALDIFKAKGEYTSSEKPIMGRVPGVEVGDEFHYRVELMIMRLHRPPQGGIDYVKEGTRVIATSIVESGGYDNIVDNSDVWEYTGQGGNEGHEDQKLEKGNLALHNSINEKNAIRVIRGIKETIPSTTSGGKPKISRTYTYYGLYTVESCRQATGKRGKLEFKFQLKRVPGQPALAWKEVKKSKNFKTRQGRCVDDISEGKERFPVCAINTVDGEKPPPFTYITHMTYPDWCNPLPPQGCGCLNGCSDSNQCSCVVRNGGEFPYNLDGQIIEIKPLVYECGPSCKCPPSCSNRVSQHGIKFQLEIFKTESRGWGVRSLRSIPSGSFICEYAGKLLNDKEAELRTGNDEYLFDIGGNCTGNSLSESAFTIDAAQWGNVGRYINHSCSPNLYAQNVLYDHHDAKIPHVMLFAAENIPPLKELTYDYNYAEGQVHDKDGNLKSKPCYCGSSECTGRLY